MKKTEGRRLRKRPQRGFLDLGFLSPVVIQISPDGGVFKDKLI